MKSPDPYRIGAITRIERLSCKIIDFVDQEARTPAKCAPHLEQEDPKQWLEAWELWESWMESLWKDLAITHAGEPLSDSEFQERYGSWKGKKKEKGEDVLWLVGCMRRPGNGWMH